MTLRAMVGLVILVAACASEESLFEDAPKDYRTKVVVLQVEGNRAALVADEAALSTLARIPGVLKVERGSGRSEVYCLVDAKIDGWDLVERLTPRYNVKVLRTVNREDAGKE